MATVSELSTALSDLTGVSPADIQHRARLLRENGVLPQKGRGVSAAHVTAKDCAGLVLALLAKSSDISAATAVVRAVKVFGALKGEALKIQIVPDEVPVPEEYDRDFTLAPAGTFLTAFTAIIEGRRAVRQFDPYFCITGAGLTTKAGVTMGWLEVTEGKKVRRHHYGRSKAALLASENFVTESRISQTVFYELSKLLAQAELKPGVSKPAKSETAQLVAPSEPVSKAMPGVISTRALKSKHLDGTTQKRERQSPSPYHPPEEIGDEKLSPQYSTQTFRRLP